MKAMIKIGKVEGFVSSYSLVFENGLRLTTENLTWKSSGDKADIRIKFYEVVDSLCKVGLTVTNDEEDSVCI